MFDDFRILPRDGLRSLLTALAAGLAVGAAMALADATLFRNDLPQVEQLVREWLLGPRMAHYIAGAVVDELVYRLLGVTVLAWLLRRTGMKANAAAIGAIVLVALVLYPLGHLAYVRSLDPTAMTLLRELALHGGSGIVWGWLYWRHGWVSGVVGHASAHLALQPLVTIL